jgi:TPR repeat protein
MPSTARIAAFIALSLSATVVCSADLQKGLAAFDEGDYVTSLAECQPLAEEGNVTAQFCVGRLYANGFGVAMDDALALKWYGLAADGGHTEAQYNLGVMHANGWGVQINEVSAVVYYQLAAELGYAPAQTALGFSYKHGAGVEKDLVNAVKWFDIAAQRDDPNAASESEDLAINMSEDDLRKAQQAAAVWLNSFDPDPIQAERTE